MARRVGLLCPNLLPLLDPLAPMLFFFFFCFVLGLCKSVWWGLAVLEGLLLVCFPLDRSPLACGFLFFGCFFLVLVHQTMFPCHHLLTRRHMLSTILFPRGDSERRCLWLAGSVGFWLPCMGAAGGSCPPPSNTKYTRSSCSFETLHVQTKRVPYPTCMRVCLSAFLSVSSVSAYLSWIRTARGRG